jgi:soluble lytic murein transglycosylase
MHLHLRTLVMSALVLVVTAAQAGSDASFLAARDAFGAGNRQAFERNAAGLESHVLAPYIEYYRLRLDLDQASPDTVSMFLERHAGTLLAQRLRSDWLRLLAKNQQWADYRASTHSCRQVLRRPRRICAAMRCVRASMPPMPGAR